MLSVSEKDGGFNAYTNKTLEMASEKEQYDYIVEKFADYNQFSEGNFGRYIDSEYVYGNPVVKYYYEALSALESKEAKELAAKFTEIDNVLLKEMKVTTDSFGQVSEYENKSYIYDIYGNQMHIRMICSV